MAEGRGRERWSHTSLICALLANAHRDPKKSRPFKPEDFNPCLDRRDRREAIEIDEQTIGLLREAFTGQRATCPPDAASS